jgi:glycosyltransferase involved in cell wall biosynthesis
MAQESAGMRRVVVIAGENLPFPSGMASTERVKALGRVFQEAGWSVEVAVLRPTEPRERVRNREVSGEWSGLTYWYCSGSSVHASGWLGRRRDEVKGMMKFARRVRRLRQGSESVVVVGYTLSPVFSLPMLMVSRLSGARYLQEVCEWLPATTRERNESPLARLTAQVFCKLVAPASDGVIVISRFIAQRFLDSGVRADRIVRVPALVSSVTDATAVDVPDARLVFAGTGAYREIIEFVLDLCGELKRRGRGFTCDILLGLTREIDGPEIARSLSERGLGEHVQLVGYLTREDYEQTLASAAALLIPLPELDSSRARFPNKMIEYLLTGRPVVSNAIGEVAAYFSDRINAVVCRRFDVLEFADGIEWILDHREDADRCGRQGRELALEHFLPQRYSRELSRLATAGPCAHSEDSRW